MTHNVRIANCRLLVTRLRTILMQAAVSAWRRQRSLLVVGVLVALEREIGMTRSTYITLSMTSIASTLVSLFLLLSRSPTHDDVELCLFISHKPPYIDLSICRYGMRWNASLLCDAVRLSAATNETEASLFEAKQQPSASHLGYLQLLLLFIDMKLDTTNFI